MAALYLPAAPARAAEALIIPPRPIDRRFPAGWCQIQETYHFSPTTSCSVYVDFLVKLTNPNGGNSFAPVILDHILIQNTSALRSSPTCGGECDSSFGLDDRFKIHNWCYSTLPGRFPERFEDFDGDPVEQGWRFGPGVSVDRFGGINNGPGLKFEQAPGVPDAPCDTARARLVLTGLDFTQQYVLTGWWSVGSIQLDAKLLYIGFSQSTDCETPGPPSAWPNLPTVCPGGGGPTPCTITGATTGCGPLNLCGPGPTDNYYYFWSGPNGFTATSQCIDAVSSGTYKLVVTDGTTLVPSDPCSVVVKQNCPLECSITGKTSICRGETSDLCGPKGVASYSWTGPNGYKSVERCIKVSEPGSYELTLHNEAGASVSCSAEVVRGTSGCPSSVACPRPPGFWDLQCDVKRRHSSALTREQLHQVAECVFQISEFFEGNPLGGFCNAIDPRVLDARRQAVRQFATLVANVCAGNLGIVTRRGARVGLDPGTVVKCSGHRQTVAELLKRIDRRLLELRRSDLRRRLVRQAYRQITECLSDLNHGEGMACGLKHDADSGEIGDADMAIEDLDVLDDAGLVQLGRPYPNPFTGASRMAFVVGTEGAPVQIGVYDISGRLVNSLVSGFVEAGRHETAWDGTDGSGSRVRPGVYFIRALIGGEHFGRQVLMTK